MSITGVNEEGVSNPEMPIALAAADAKKLYSALITIETGKAGGLGGASADQLVAALGTAIRSETDENTLAVIRRGVSAYLQNGIPEEGKARLRMIQAIFEEKDKGAEAAKSQGSETKGQIEGTIGDKLDA